MKFLKATLTFCGAIIFFAGCVGMVAPSSSPSGLQASFGTEEDRVVISWSPVDRAGVYFIYRAVSVDGDYELIGSTAQYTFIDINISPDVHYWYAVAAADYHGTPDSELRSDPVEGYGIHTFSWSGGTVGFGEEQYSMAVGTSVLGNAYAATAGANQTDISVSMYYDGSWMTVGDGFGFTEGTAVNNPVTVTEMGGVPYVGYHDVSASGKLTLRKLMTNAEGPSWVHAGESGQGSGALHSLSSTALNDSIYIVAGTIGTDLAAFSYSETEDWEVLPSPSPDASNAVLGTDGDTVYLAYEDDEAASPYIHVLTFDGSWSAPAVHSPPVLDPGDIPDGYLDFSCGATTNELALAYFDAAAGSLRVWLREIVWTDISPSVDADPNAGTVAIAADRGKVYLLYRDLETGRGTVLVYDGEWTILPFNENQEGLTGQFNLSSFSLGVHDNVLFAGVKTDTAVSTYVYD